MSDEAQKKVLQLLDVISVEVAANRIETSELRSELRAGFGRVERRLENVGVRLETVKAELQSVKTELQSFRGEFECRIAPLER